MQGNQGPNEQKRKKGNSEQFKRKKKKQVIPETAKAKRGHRIMQVARKA